jgi:hypothetical protein
LRALAKAIGARFEHIDTMSHKAVRRLLKLRDIAHYRAKHWLTSPDPRYELRKRQRDRLLAMALGAPGAGSKDRGCSRMLLPDLDRCATGRLSADSITAFSLAGTC